MKRAFYSIVGLLFAVSLPLTSCSSSTTPLQTSSTVISEATAPESESSETFDPTRIDFMHFFQTSAESQLLNYTITDQGCFALFHTLHEETPNFYVLLHLGTDGKERQRINITYLLPDEMSAHEQLSIHASSTGQLYLLARNSTEASFVIQLLNFQGMPTGSFITYAPQNDESGEADDYLTHHLDGHNYMYATGYTNIDKRRANFFDVFDPEGQFLFRCFDNFSKAAESERWKFLDLFFSDDDATYVAAHFPEGHVLLPIDLEKQELGEPLPFQRNLLAMQYRGGEMYYPNANGLYLFTLDGQMKEEILRWNRLKINFSFADAVITVVSSDILFISEEISSEDGTPEWTSYYFVTRKG